MLRRATPIVQDKVNAVSLSRSIRQLKHDLHDPAKLSGILSELSVATRSARADASVLVFEAIDIPDLDTAEAALGALMGLNHTWANEKIYWVQDDQTVSQSPLQRAVCAARPRLFDILINAGAIMVDDDPDGCSALDIAANPSHMRPETPAQVAMLAHILDSINLNQNQIDRALCHAAKGANLKTVRLLLGRGARLGQEFWGRNAIACVCERSDDPSSALPVIDLLLAQPGAHQAIHDDWSVAGLPTAPMQVAAAHGNVAILDRLIAAGATPDPPAHLPPNSVDPPLTCAVIEQHEKAVEFLLAAGANPNVTGCGMNNALHALSVIDEPLADPHLTERICRMLLQAGTDPAACNQDGQCALELAASRNKPAVHALISSAILDQSTAEPRAASGFTSPRF